MMLDGIRANAQNWGVKLAFGIIIVVFVFWGIGSYTGPKGIVASVNGKNITEAEFMRARQNMEENVRRNVPDITPEMWASLNLDQQVLQGLMQEKLIEHEAERAGLTVSLYELRALLEQLPYFQTDGKFDAELYKRLLAQNHMTPQQFEAEQARGMLPAKLQRLVGAGAYAGPEMVKPIFEYAAEKRRVEYLSFPASAHMDKAAPTEDEVVKTYEEQSGSFTVPPTAKVEFVRLDPTVIGDPEAITEEQLRAAYEARLSSYTEPEQIQARHILIKVAANASEADVKKAEDEIKALEARIRGGEDFAEVAKAHGQDGTREVGGDLGWFTDGQMVPEFSKAAFALAEGELSAPVRTQFGFHLIKKEGHKPAVTKSFDEVKDSLRVTLAAQEASKGLEAQADAVLAQALSGKSMDDAAMAANAKGIKAETSELLSEAQLASALGVRDADMKNIMGAPAGTVIDVPVVAGPNLLVIKVLENNPQTVKPLEEVRSIIVEFLTHQKAAELAMEEARKARTTFKDGHPADGVAFRQTEPFGRDGAISDLIADPALADAAFKQESVTSEWMMDPFRTQDGAVLIRLSSIEAPSEEEWKEVEDDMIQTMLTDRASMVYQMYITQLGREAEVRLFDSPYLKDMQK